eukprot:1365482-Pleurochrysis_carterae.AAC.1
MLGKKQQHSRRVQQQQLRRRACTCDQAAEGARRLERQGDGLGGEHHQAAAHDQPRANVAARAANKENAAG